MNKMNVTLLGMLCSMVTSTAFGYGGAVAIVINPKAHTYGASVGLSTRQDAEAYALSKCGKTCANVDVATLEGGNSGLLEAYTMNGWAAVSVSHAGDIGLSDPTANGSQSIAEYSAYDACGGAAKGCYIYRSTSSFTNSADIDGVRPTPNVSAPPAN